MSKKKALQSGQAKTDEQFCFNNWNYFTMSPSQNPKDPRDENRRFMTFIKNYFQNLPLTLVLGFGLSFGFGAGVALSSNPHKLEIKTHAGSVILETSSHSIEQNKRL